MTSQGSDDGHKYEDEESQYEDEASQDNTNVVDDVDDCGPLGSGWRRKKGRRERREEAHVAD